ncbi:MAG: peptidylprolyl isomerase [Spirochaetales bacterium]|nr:peptidylprolyl isomerase [Spirochaetales bacterium]
MGSRENRRRKSKLAEDNIRSVEKKKSSNKLMWFGSLILLVLIVVTFIGAPLLTQFSSSERIIFGTYKGKSIEYKAGNYFSKQRDYLADQIQDSERDYENIEWQIYQIWKEAYDRTVLHTALLELSESSEMLITDEQLDRMIVEQGPYLVDGEFSERLYNNTSNAEKQTNRSFMLESVKADLVRQDLLTPVISDAEADFIKSMASVERKFRFITFPFSEFPKDRIAAYGEENRDLFRKISLSRITIKSDKKAAETVYQQLQQDPLLFGDLARSHSEDAYAEKGGEMGSIRYYSALSMFSESSDVDYIFDLQPGEVSKIIEGPSGFMIYRCDIAAGYADLTSELEIQEVRNYMERFERGIIEDYFLQAGEDFLSEAETNGFESAALLRGKLYKETDYFPVNYGNLAFQFYGTAYPVFQSITVNGEINQLFQSAARDLFFLSAIHSLNEGEYSEPLILDDNIVIMECTGVKTVPDEELEMLTMVYPAAVQYWYDQDFTRLVFQSEDFEDNFNQEFTRIFLSQEQ